MSGMTVARPGVAMMCHSSRLTAHRWPCTKTFRDLHQAAAQIVMDTRITLRTHNVIDVAAPQVWLLRGVALEDQAAQLLRLGDSAGALALVDTAAVPWAPLVASEAAFLLLHSARRGLCRMCMAL